MKRIAVPSPGWELVSEPHRCSAHRCDQPAVAVSTVRARRWDGTGRSYTRGRWWCADHLLQVCRFVRSGRVWSHVFSWSPTADLSFRPPFLYPGSP